MGGRHPALSSPQQFACTAPASDPAAALCSPVSCSMNHPLPRRGGQCASRPLLHQTPTNQTALAAAAAAASASAAAPLAAAMAIRRRHHHHHHRRRHHHHHHHHRRCRHTPPPHLTPPPSTPPTTPPPTPPPQPSPQPTPSPPPPPSARRSHPRPPSPQSPTPQSPSPLPSMPPPLQTFRFTPACYAQDAKYHKLQFPRPRGLESVSVINIHRKRLGANLRARRGAAGVMCLACVLAKRESCEIPELACSRRKIDRRLRFPKGPGSWKVCP